MLHREPKDQVWEKAKQSNPPFQFCGGGKLIPTQLHPLFSPKGVSWQSCAKKERGWELVKKIQGDGSRGNPQVSQEEKIITNGR